MQCLLHWAKTTVPHQLLFGGLLHRDSLRVPVPPQDGPLGKTLSKFLPEQLGSFSLMSLSGLGEILIYHCYHKICQCHKFHEAIFPCLAIRVAC